MGYNVIEAIRIALKWKEGEKVSITEAEALKRYAGFGGIKAMLYPNSTKEEWINHNATESDLKLYPKIMELHKLLQEHFDEKKYKEIIDSVCFKRSRH